MGVYYVVIARGKNVERQKRSWNRHFLLVVMLLCGLSIMLACSGSDDAAPETQTEEAKGEEPQPEKAPVEERQLEEPQKSETLKSWVPDGGFWDEEYDEEINALIEAFSQSISKSENLQQYFALEEYVNGYDVNIAAERTGLSVEQITAPTLESRVSEIIEEMVKVPYGFSFRYDADGEAVQDEITQSSEYIEKLKLIRIDRPAPRLYHSQEYQDLMQRQIATYGADNRFDRMAMYEIEGQYYICPFNIYQYGDSMKIYNLNMDTVSVIMIGPLLGPDEYEWIIDDNDIWKNKVP